MKRTKICCFCETWASGGIESFLTNLFSHMNMSELEVDIVVAQKKESVFTAQLQALGIKFFELSGNRNYISLNSKMFCDLLWVRKYDVIHINAFHGGALYYLQLAKKFGVPIRIAHSHNTALRKSKTRLIKLLIHEVAKIIYAQCATEYWACSLEAAAFLLSKSTFKKQYFKLVPNGIDIMRFKFSEKARNEVRTELGLDNSFVIGNVGRLCYQKNQKFLIDLLPELLRKHPDATLLLVGEGEEKNNLIAYAKKLDVEDKVIFVGVTKSPERIYSALDVFVFPSRFEGFGIVAIEAQCSGLPVICSDEVPSVAIVLDSAKSMSLSCSASVWANEICNLHGQRPSRDDAFIRIGERGYDVTAIAKWVENKFLLLAKESE